MGENLKSLIKPFRNIKTRSGKLYFCVPTESGLYLTNGREQISLNEYHNDLSHASMKMLDIMVVYEVPSAFGYITFDQSWMTGQRDVIWRR